MKKFENMDYLKVINMYASLCPKCRAELKTEQINEDTFTLECSCGFRKKIVIEDISR